MARPKKEKHKAVFIPMGAGWIDGSDQTCGVTREGPGRILTRHYEKIQALQVDYDKYEKTTKSFLGGKANQPYYIELSKPAPKGFTPVVIAIDPEFRGLDYGGRDNALFGALFPDTDIQSGQKKHYFFQVTGEVFLSADYED